MWNLQWRDGLSRISTRVHATRHGRQDGSADRVDVRRRMTDSSDGGEDRKTVATTF